jgi:hypothetical protein
LLESHGGTIERRRECATLHAAAQTATTRSAVLHVQWEYRHDALAGRRRRRVGADRRTGISTASGRRGGREQRANRPDPQIPIWLETGFPDSAGNGRRGPGGGGPGIWGSQCTSGTGRGGPAGVGASSCESWMGSAAWSSHPQRSAGQLRLPPKLLASREQAAAGGAAAPTRPRLLRPSRAGDQAIVSGIISRFSPAFVVDQSLARISSSSAPPELTRRMDLKAT